MSKIDLYDFRGYTYAMEIVNGEILSMSGNFQHKVRTALKKKLHISDNTLKAYLHNRLDNKRPDDQRFKPVADYNPEYLSKILGYNY